jgi:hypothetical protein
LQPEILLHDQSICSFLNYLCHFPQLCYCCHCWQNFKTQVAWFQILILLPHWICYFFFLCFLLYEQCHVIFL